MKPSLDVKTVRRENESRHFQTIVYLVREIRKKANSTDFCDLLEQLPVLVNQLNDEYRKFLVDYCNLHWQCLVAQTLQHAFATCQHAKTKKEDKMNEFGKTVKKRLIDLDMTQTELCAEIKSKYGYSADSGVMHRLFHDKLHSERLKDYIREILGLEE